MNMRVPQTLNPPNKLAGYTCWCFI